VGPRTGAASILVSTTTTILLGVALGGCGGAGGSHSATGHAPASHPAGGNTGVSSQAVAIHPTPITRSFTKAQATAFVHAVNLTAADLPGFTQEENQEAGSQSPGLFRCAGIAVSRPLVTEASSEEFKRAGQAGAEAREAFGSRVAVMPTASLATRALAAIRSRRGETCMKNELNEQYSGKSNEEESFTLVSMVERPLEVSGVSEGYELQTVTKATKGEHSIDIFMDILGFIDGPAEVALTAVGTPQAVSPAAEQHLISVLFERAQANG
jgi:hypothetical protein